MTDHVADAALPADSFQQALKVAFELHNAGRHAAAEAVCRVLLQLDARDAQLLFLLGMVLHKTARSAEGAACLEQAAALQPTSARIFNGLGNVRQKLGDLPGAMSSYTQAVELGLRSGDLYYSMGNACYQLGDVERAVSLFQAAVAAAPQDAASWNNLGKCLKDTHRLDEALAAYDEALRIDPGHLLAHYGRTIVLLQSRRWPEGFREYNRWRHQRHPLRQFTQAAWQGEPIPGQTLFLHAEQGFGDAIQYIRFIPQARGKAAKVILECRPELKTLFAESNCADVVIAYGEEIPPFDRQTSLLSLPGLLGTTVETIPRGTPYLSAPAAGLLPAAGPGHRKVGLAWAGNPTHHNDAARSMRAVELEPLLSAPNATFHSLQLPVPARDAEWCARAPLKNVGMALEDFSHTAGIVTQLDLVITVDTAVGHLAGALGKPTWLLLPYSPDWRWFSDEETTPWYPTMRLFRQTRRGQWAEVLQRVSAALSRFQPADGKWDPADRPGSRGFVS